MTFGSLGTRKIALWDLIASELPWAADAALAAASSWRCLLRLWMYPPRSFFTKLCFLITMISNKTVLKSTAKTEPTVCAHCSVICKCGHPGAATSWKHVQHCLHTAQTLCGSVWLLKVYKNWNCAVGPDVHISPRQCYSGAKRLSQCMWVLCHAHKHGSMLKGLNTMCVLCAPLCDALRVCAPLCDALRLLSRESIASYNFIAPYRSKYNCDMLWSYGKMQCSLHTDNRSTHHMAMHRGLWLLTARPREKCMQSNVHPATLTNFKEL